MTDQGSSTSHERRRVRERSVCSDDESDLAPKAKRRYNLPRVDDDAGDEDSFIPALINQCSSVGPSMSQKTLTELTASQKGQPWGAVLMISELKLDQTLADHIEVNRERNDMDFLRHESSQILNDKAPSHKSSDTPITVLVDCQLYCEKIWRANSMEAVAYLFWILLIGDMAEIVCGSVKAEQQLGRLIDLLPEDKRSEPPTPKTLTAFFKSVKRGARLVWFCKQFGTGSLFYLHETFSHEL